MKALSIFGKIQVNIALNANNVGASKQNLGRLKIETRFADMCVNLARPPMMQTQKSIEKKQGTKD